jgi:hypothetical protein
MKKKLNKIISVLCILNFSVCNCVAVKKPTRSVKEVFSEIFSLKRDKQVDTPDESNASLKLPEEKIQEINMKAAQLAGLIVDQTGKITKETKAAMVYDVLDTAANLFLSIVGLSVEIFGVFHLFGKCGTVMSALRGGPIIQPELTPEKKLRMMNDVIIPVDATKITELATTEGRSFGTLKQRLMEVNAFKLNRKANWVQLVNELWDEYQTLENAMSRS